jgi:type II secretory pathway pseudopilin PulG
MRRQGAIVGFSLLELIVVMAILVGVAGVVFPLLSAEIQDSKISRALDDTSRIASALAKASRDVGFIPGADEAKMPPSAMLTAGKRPAGLPLGHQRKLGDFLGVDAPYHNTKNPWKGPYLGEVGADPWMRAYTVILPAKGEAGHVWVLSSGPDGVLQTSELSDSLCGDDVGVCLR